MIPSLENIGTSLGRRTFVDAVREAAQQRIISELTAAVFYYDARRLAGELQPEVDKAGCDIETQQGRVNAAAGDLAAAAEAVKAVQHNLIDLPEDARGAARVMLEGELSHAENKRNERAAHLRTAKSRLQSATARLEALETLQKELAQTPEPDMSGLKQALDLI